MTNDAKNALLAILEKVAYVNENGQTYYDALETALYPPADLVSISAVFNQGSAVIYTSDTLDTLKQYLTVTALYSDSTTEVVTNYALSGELSEGTSTITVSYGGKTDTFSVTVTKYMPSGYVTDGLVFFLDGKSSVSANRWSDIIGGKEFTLTNCTLGTNGVVFDGTAYGQCTGAITNNWSSETIELVLTGRSNITASTAFSQPYVNNNVGISMRFGGSGSNSRFIIAFDNTDRYASQTASAISTDTNRISATTDYHTILNEVATTGRGYTKYSKNETGDTYLGAHRTTTESSVTAFYIGTIHAIRIYNRKLTDEEIVANQQRDITYYGL